MPPSAPTHSNGKRDESPTVATGIFAAVHPDLFILLGRKSARRNAAVIEEIHETYFSDDIMEPPTRQDVTGIIRSAIETFRVTDDETEYDTASADSYGHRLYRDLVRPRLFGDEVDDVWLPNVMHKS